MSAENARLRALLRALWGGVPGRDAPGIAEAVEAELEGRRPRPCDGVSVVMERTLRGRPLLIVRLDDEQELHLSVEQAAALVTVLLADGEVHRAWLHGGVSDEVARPSSTHWRTHDLP